MLPDNQGTLSLNRYSGSVPYLLLIGLLSSLFISVNLLLQAPDSGASVSAPCLALPSIFCCALVPGLCE